MKYFFLLLTVLLVQCKSISVNKVEEPAYYQKYDLEDGVRGISFDFKIPKSEATIKEVYINDIYVDFETEVLQDFLHIKAEKVYDNGGRGYDPRIGVKSRVLYFNNTFEAKVLILNNEVLDTVYVKNFIAR